MKIEEQKMAGNIYFENWTPDQVAEWLRGLDMDDAMIPYMHYFLASAVDGKKLMVMTHSDLEKLNVLKFGHQELILEAIDLLKNLRYGYETENLQTLALQLGCKARSLKSEVRARTSENDRNRANIHTNEVRTRKLPINILSTVADLVAKLKSLVGWMDKAPFSGFHDLCLTRNSIVKHGLDLISMCQREMSLVDFEYNITNTTTLLSDICEKLVIGSPESPLDPLYLQPAALELATIRKKQGEELGMHLLFSYDGVHVISGVKDMSPADLCGKIEKGDEVIQVNNQIVAGWSLKKLVNLLKENPKEVTLLLKKRPRHIVPYGQMPNKRQAQGQVSTLPKSRKKLRSRDGDSTKLRPSLQELVNSVPGAGEHEDMDSPKEVNDGNDTDNDVFRSGSESPQFTQYTLPVQPDTKQRRATVSGGSPPLSRPLLVIEDIDTPTRPKSFTIPSSTGSMPHEIIINSPSGENLSELSKLASALEKRQEYKTKSTPPSLEFSVRKPTPKIVEPKTLDVPDIQFIMRKETKASSDSASSGKTPPKSADTKDNVSKVGKLEAEKGKDHQKKTAESVHKHAEKSPSTDSKDEKDIKVVSNDIEDKKVIKSANIHNKQSEAAVDDSQDIRVSDSQNLTPDNPLDSSSDSVAMSESSINYSQTSVESSILSQPPDVDDHFHSSDKESLAQLSDGVTSPPLFPPAPRSLEALTQRTPPLRRTPNREVAGSDFDKNQPQLTKIRKIGSVHSMSSLEVPTVSPAGHKDHKEKHVGFEGVDSDKEGDPNNSYVCRIVGGVVQKIPVESPSTVQRRQKTGRKRVNRRISCKDLGTGDCEGWLFKRRNKNSVFQSNWHTRWCVIKEFNFFCFHGQEALKAEVVIHLPAFRVSPVESSVLKTNKYAFKIHNAGTSFTFASDRQEDMSKWMNRMGLASINLKREVKVDPNRSPYCSESDSDSSSHQGSKESSPAPSPQISRHKQSSLAVAPTDLRASQEDLPAMLRKSSQRGQSILGEDKNKQRRKTITKEFANKVSPEVIAMKKKGALERTLRAKEMELEEIDAILTSKSPEKLRSFKQSLDKRQQPELTTNI
ncbi:CNK3/IPCEF1 fusion protein-like isoform X2 [Dreissena polymorpha]|uniref:CNK3/IPCEF1 fusion protein-like isoform X2 n=1 Tax=Dreissena polymorpha TaxID=45954 RepID=UPI002263DF88|nr:CNK3/IPCEF1 fusion protein-like isoform X2 [Dreissena polymorpha]